jgi:hypothetical protein
VVFARALAPPAVPSYGGVRGRAAMPDDRRLKLPETPPAQLRRDGCNSI